MSLRMDIIDASRHTHAMSAPLYSSHSAASSGRSTSFNPGTAKQKQEQAGSQTTHPGSESPLVVGLLIVIVITFTTTIIIILVASPK